MNDFFYVDTKLNYFKTWKNLIEDLNELEYFNSICKGDDYYNIFLNVISSLLLNKEIVLLDDFFDNELETNEKINFSLNFSDKQSFINHVFNNCSKWKISLYTSGTTGNPKKVTHSINSITRFIKKDKQNSIWGLAFNPTHISGIQVFFQSFLNGNSLIRLFGLNKDEIFKLIEQYNITHISSTPTFYKLLLPTKNIYPTVLRISSGGEKIDKETIKILSDIFINSKINNIYASTEFGTLFSSDGEVFTIKENMIKKIKVKNNELLVHKSLLGILSYFNEKENWYKTGDLVEIISKNPLKIKFVSRKNEIINVGGYNINPYEIEDVIKSYDGILDARVIGKNNSVLGNIIICDVITKNKITELELRKFLKTKLQKYKIPRIINFVDNFSITNTGKTKKI
jgi:acyl-coenzyme A synthetase/AMP-(fatty) acid ligase